MVSLSDKALAIVLGIETIAGKGPTGRAGRAALKAGARAILAGTIVIAPPVAKATARTAAANPLLAAGLLGTAAYQAGYLDPAIQRAQEESFRAQENLRRLAMESPVQRAYEMAGRPTFGEAVEQLVPIAKKRTLSKFNRAVKAGMAAVKRSKFMGKPGTIKNPKQAFARVNKVASTINQGRKAGTSGVVGVIKRGIGKIL